MLVTIKPVFLSPVMMLVLSRRSALGLVVIQEGRLYRDGTFEEIFSNVHQYEVYHLLLDKSAESVLKQRFPELDYKVLNGGISVETRNPDLYRLLLEETEVLQFTREPAYLEDLLYEVLK